jgi:hypothetical protein
MRWLKEEMYRSDPLVNSDEDRVRITFHLTKRQWLRWKQKFLLQLARIRREN